jgi:hypothetical protein
MTDTQTLDLDAVGAYLKDKLEGFEGPIEAENLPADSQTRLFCSRHLHATMCCAVNPRESC